MQQIRDFLSELDALWDLRIPNRIRLPLFGSGALLLQTNYERLTKDSDIFETSEHTPEVRRRLEELGGRGTALYQRHRMYLEIVPNGIPFLPHLPTWHSVDISLVAFELQVLDVVDVVVSKLARFSADDQGDIDQMIRRGYVSPEQFEERFRDAVSERASDARADQLPLFVDRFHRVQRDMFGIAETDIDLPSWI